DRAIEVDHEGRIQREVLRRGWGRALLRRLCGLLFVLGLGEEPHTATGSSGGQYGHQRGDQDRTTRLGGLVLLGGLLGFVSGCGHGVKLLRVASPGYASSVPKAGQRDATEFRRIP